MSEKTNEEDGIRCPACNSFIYLEWAENHIRDMQLKELKFRAKLIESKNRKIEELEETIKVLQDMRK